ncbi:MAG: elongation factor Ts [Melioribacteraceae bacterium]|nr:MAG: elongation factor Ts [Melioribacteraceae bacterium]
MAITAAQVKELRDKTGAGMMDCKKALTEADGDFEKAVEILRKKGASVAAKRAERTASEGVVLTRSLENGAAAAMIEVNCETDFVAKSDDFVKFAEFAFDVVLENKPANVEELLSLGKDNTTVAKELETIMGKIGEKIEVSRFVIESSDNGVVVGYVHHGSKLGVLVRVDNTGDKNEAIEPIIKDMAMQVAAMRPEYAYREEVPQSVIEKEIDIYKEVLRKEGKPENMLDKIATGKLNKFYAETCLLEQAYIKDNSKTIGALLKEFNKENSIDAKLKLFHRFSLSDEKK